MKGWKGGMSLEEGGGGGKGMERGMELNMSPPWWGGIEAKVVMGVMRFGGRPGLETKIIFNASCQNLKFNTGF